MSITILGISGSLRAQSLNTALLREAARSAGEGVELTIAPLGDLPLFDEDREAEDAGGSAVAALVEAVQAADAVLFSTPEYNSSMPGVLKNAIDWLSRGSVGTPLADKLVAVTGVTPGPWGTRYAQRDLRNVLIAVGAQLARTKAMYVREGKKRVTDGEISDDKIASRIAALVEDLAAQAERA